MRPDNSYIFWLEPLRDGFNTKEAGVRILWLLLRQTLKRFANCKTMPFSSLSSGKYRYLQQCYNVQWTCYFLFFFNVYVYYCWFSFERQRGEQESIFLWWFVLQTSAGVPKWGWSQEPVLTAGLDCGWGSPLLPLRGYRKQAAEVRAGAGVERRFSDRDKGRCKWHLNFSTQQPRINKYLFNYLKVNTCLQNISLLGPAW